MVLARYVYEIFRCMPVNILFYLVPLPLQIRTDVTYFVLGYASPKSEKGILTFFNSFDREIVQAVSSLRLTVSMVVRFGQTQRVGHKPHAI
jgi:hypothetical protein